MKAKRWPARIGFCCLALLSIAQLQAQEKQPARLAPYTIRIKAVLLDKAGAALNGKTVWSYPLNAKGEALIVRTMPPGYVQKVWNAVAQTDSAGGVVLEIPLVTRIDDAPIAELVVGVGSPSGGLSLRSEKGIEYAD